jgi:hypothetical protein
MILGRLLLPPRMGADVTCTAFDGAAAGHVIIELVC